MKIFGIDHATVHAGAALLQDGAFTLYEAINLKDFNQWSPMYAMFHLVGVYIDEHRPDVIALEKPMALRNGDVARKLIEVYSGAKLASEHAKVPVIEVTPQLAKMYVAGHAGADKEDVAMALQARFELDYDDIAIPILYKDKKRKGQVKERLFDVSDACALAVAAWEIKRKEPVVNV